MKTWEGITLIIIALLVGVFCGYLLNASQSDLVKENQILQSVLKAEISVAEASPTLMKGEYYYDLASYSYEIDEYKDVELYCKQARTYYTEAGQDLRDIKAEMEFEHPIIDSYKGILDENIIMTTAMYTACEHFESAARYYDKLNWDMGGVEIDMMNDQITIHDNSVERYNNHLAELKVELNKLIEE